MRGCLQPALLKSLPILLPSLPAANVQTRDCSKGSAQIHNSNFFKYVFLDEEEKVENISLQLFWESDLRT